MKTIGLIPTKSASRSKAKSKTAKAANEDAKEDIETKAANEDAKGAE